MSIVGKEEIVLKVPVNLPNFEPEIDDLPDLICEECGVIVGWDNLCNCNGEIDNE
jgi:hypothetical protein